MTQVNPSDPPQTPTLADQTAQAKPINPAKIVAPNPRLQAQQTESGPIATQEPANHPSQDVIPADVVEKTGQTGGSSLPTPVSPVSSGPDAELPPLVSEQDFADDVYTPSPASNPVVDAIKANGLYVKDQGNSIHRLKCPWSTEHPPEFSGEAAYMEPCGGRPIGQFKCWHKHAEKRDEHSLIDHLGITPDVARAKAVIHLPIGETYRAVAASERVLAADGRYFNAGGPIVRIIRTRGESIKSELVNDQTLSAFLASKIDYYKKARGNDWERCDPPASVIQSLRYNQDRANLRTLTGLSRQPFYGSDGRLIIKAGYDELTGIYADFGEATYDLGSPTRDDAELQRDYLNWLLREFEFASDADRSAALAAILTAVVRPSLSLAPAFNINAPRSGGGKSFLAALIALGASPDQPYSVTYPTTAEEASKQVLAVLLEKPAVILFDDMQSQSGWKSLGPINKALTSPTITERVMGASRTATARTNVLFLGTGNNVEPSQDMRRRVVSIRLAPRSETPSLRAFAFNPVAHVRADRARLVQSALTIIEAYRLAGRPACELPSIGSYEDWSMACRNPLVWLGEPDPATSLIEQVRNDDDQDILGDLLELWFKLFDDEPMMVRELVLRAARDAKFAEVLDETGVMDGAAVNTRRLGWYLKDNLGRWARGLRLVRGPSSQRNTWRVMSD